MDEGGRGDSRWTGGGRGDSVPEGVKVRSSAVESVLSDRVIHAVFVGFCDLCTV